MNISFLTKGNNSCDFLFVFPDKEALSNWGLLFKEEFAPCKRKFFHFRIFRNGIRDKFMVRIITLEMLQSQEAIPLIISAMIVFLSQMLRRHLSLFNLLSDKIYHTSSMVLFYMFGPVGALILWLKCPCEIYIPHRTRIMTYMLALIVAKHGHGTESIVSPFLCNMQYVLHYQFHTFRNLKQIHLVLNTG